MIIGIEPRHSVGKYDTAYWENFLTEDEIRQILAMPEWQDMSVAKIGGASLNENIDPAVRSGKVGWMPVNESTKNIWNKLVEVIATVNSQFFKFDLTGCYEEAQLTQYDADTKAHYDWHVDASLTDRGAPRKLSMSILLSDPSEFEGGEFHVKTSSDTPITLAQARGRALFFPSYMLHRVTPVTKGVRKSLVLWVGGPEFR